MKPKTKDDKKTEKKTEKKKIVQLTDDYIRNLENYEIVSNAENWLDNNRYDSISQKWIGPDSARINYIDAEANKIEMNKKDYKNKKNENK